MLEDDRLHTVGTNDGLLKTWLTADRPLPDCYRAPHGIVSGDLTADGSRQMLLVNARGEASIHAIDSGMLRAVGRLDGNHYRTVTGPSSHASPAADEERRMASARQLEARIQEKLGAGESEGIEDLHRQLADLGFEPLSLALRADQAAQAEDLIGELSIRRRLAQTLPANDSRGVASLERYAMVLEKTWRIISAWKVRATNGHDKSDTDTLDWLSRAAAILAGEEWVVNPDLPISLLIEAATVMGQPFVGRWALKVSEPLSFHEGGLTARTLAAKYEQIKSEDNGSGLPVARAQTLWWIERATVDGIEAIVFEDSSAQGDVGPRPAVQLLSRADEGAVVPFVLFDAGPRGADRSWEDHNRRALSAYERAERDVIHVCSHKLQRALTFALQRLCNQAGSGWQC